MRLRFTLFVSLGVLLIVGGWFLSRSLTTRHLQPWRNSPHPERAWLSHEFNLEPGTAAKVEALHEAFESRCEQMCADIMAANQAVAGLMKQSTELTPELRTAFAKAEQLRGDCRMATLEHLCEIARQMPPEDARRYVDMMSPRLLRVPLPHMGHGDNVAHHP